MPLPRRRGVLRLSFFGHSPSTLYRDLHVIALQLPLHHLRRISLNLSLNLFSYSLVLPQRALFAARSPAVHIFPRTTSFFSLARPLPPWLTFALAGVPVIPCMEIELASRYRSAPTPFADISTDPRVLVILPPRSRRHHTPAPSASFLL